MKTIDQKINERAARAVGRIDARTGRPDAAYPRNEIARKIPIIYVDEFSRALGLKPSPTWLGGEIVEI